MKWIFTFIILITLTLGMLYVFSDSGENPDRNNSLSHSQQKYENSNHQLIFASGVVEGTHREILLQFEIKGRLQKIHVFEGMPVRKEDPLASLESDLWEQKLHAAQANLTFAEASREKLVNAAREETIQVALSRVEAAKVRAQQLKDKLTRTQKLLRENVVPQETYDSTLYDHQLALAELQQALAIVKEIKAPARQDDTKMADAQISVARAEVDQARCMLTRTTLRAPRDGIILRVQGEPGQLIGPDRNLPLITMTNIDQLRVRAYVEELDALSVQIGQQVYVTTDGKPDVRHQGHIVSCAPYMTPKTVLHNNPGERVDVKVREVVIELKHADDLIVGLPVEVFIRHEEDSYLSDESIQQVLSTISVTERNIQNSTQNLHVKPAGPGRKSH